MGSSKIVGSLSSMIKIANNSSKNLLILIYIAEKNKVVGINIFDKPINLFKPNIEILAKS